MLAIRVWYYAGAKKETIKVTFVKPTGEKVTVDAPIGDSMLEVAHANNIDIEGASTVNALRLRRLSA